MRKLSRIIACMLCAAMLAQAAPLGLGEGYAAAAYETVETEWGKTLRDQVIDGNLVMAAEDSLYVAGTITMKNGAIIVTGGRHEISRDAVIRGDIVVAGPAELIIDGIVEGELRLEWACWTQDDARWQQEDTPAYLNVVLGEHAVVSAIRSGSFQGDVTILGSVAQVETEDMRSAEAVYGRGTISFCENAFGGSVSARGGAAPSINMWDDPLVDRILISGGAELTAYGGRINELTVKNGGNCYLNEMEAGSIDASGEGVWIHAHGTTIGQVSLSNPRSYSADVQDWYSEKRTVMTADKGATIEGVTASGLSSFTVSNIDIDEAESFAGQPIASLDREQLFKESRVGSVVTSGPVCLENNAYIESVMLGRGGVMWGSGMTERLEATDASVGFGRRCELNDNDSYHNRVRGTYNEEYYQGISVGFSSIRGGSVDFAEGTGAGTVIAEDTYVNLGQFHQIENLVLNNVRILYVAEDEKWAEIVTSFEKEERIGRLFFNSSTENVHRNGLPAMQIGTLSIYSHAMPAIADIDRLLLPNGQKGLFAGVQGRAAQGTRPEAAEAPEKAEKAAEEPTVNYYVSSMDTIQMKKGGNGKAGGTSRSKAEPLALGAYQIGKTGMKDWWYTVETDALQTLNIVLDADEGMGMLVVYGPQEQREVLVSEQGKAEISLVSAQGGIWTLRLIGAQNDYALSLGVSDPIRVALDATVQPANSRGNGKETALDLEKCSLKVENVTRGTQPVFFVTPDGIVMATDQGQQGDTLRIEMTDPEDAFIPVSAEVKLDRSLQARAKLGTAEYGSYAVSCQDAAEVYMHLYDEAGAYMMTLSPTGGTYRADKLLPGTYHLVMIRGNMGRWRFSRLSDYAAFGLMEKRDYRLDTFTLRRGYTDSYPGASVPAEPVIDSAYVAEESSRFDAARSVCLENGSVLMRVEYALENEEALTECTVEIELRGMEIDPGAVTMNGAPVVCTLENNVLRIPVQGQTAGKIAFYAHSTEAKEMLAIGRLHLQTAQGSEMAYLGSVAIEKQQLSIYASPESGGVVNLFGYGVPGERLTILRDGAVAAYAECNMNGLWNRTLHMEAAVGYESYAFAAAVYAGTENELVSAPVTVRVQQDTPSLTGVELYYYEHEYQRKLSLSAEQFYRGGLSFSYLPGSAFTIKFTFDKPDRIEEMDLVLSSKTGDAYVFPCEYNPVSCVFTASGEFPRGSMGNTLRLNWRLSPLPEPEPLPSFDSEAAEKALQLEATPLNARVEDDYLECDMQLILGGKDLGVSTLRLEFNDTFYDIERLEEEALMRYDLDADGAAYLMGDEQHPESLYLVYVDAENDAAMRLDSVGSLLTALLPSAYAEEDEVEDIGQLLVDLGASLIFDFTTGLGGSVIEVMSYDTMMIATYMLRNKVDEKWQSVLREIEQETNPERLRCLTELAMLYGNLYDDCTDAAQKYADNAKWDGISALGGKIFKPKTLKTLGNLGRAMQKLKDARRLKKAAINTYERLALELQKDIDEMISLKKPDWTDPDKWKEYIDLVFDHKDEIIKLIEAIRDKPLDEMTLQELEAFEFYWDMINYSAADDDKFLEKTYENFQKYIPEIIEMYDTAMEINEKNEELKEVQKNLQQEKEELEQIDAQLTQSAMDMAGQTAQGVFGTMVDAADGLRSQFSEDYNRVLNQYYYLLTIDCPQPTPTPKLKPTETPAASPSPTPSPSPSPVPTAAPSSTPADGPTDTPAPSATPTPSPATAPADTPVNPDSDNPPSIVVVIEPIPDPSGYVYEGMWSNRISGVQAIAYTRDANGETVQWDAEPYGQENPTLTDEQGYYEWYVPEGEWRVEYRKDGYEEAQSDWMAVTPPQTEVHQNLISYEPPQLLYARHYGDAVELAFNKPIRVETVNGQTLTIGEGFAVQAMNPERYGETDMVLATLFRLIPEKQLPREILLELTEGITSYAGVPCGQTSLSCTRTEPLLGINSPAVVNARAGETISLSIQARDGDFESYRLTVSGVHEDLLRIDSIGGFDASGCAVIEMTPLTSGVVLLDIAVQDTRISTAVKLIITEQ